MAAVDDQPLAHPYHPRVLSVIRAVLLEQGWPPHDIEDGIGKVVVKAWASQRPHPDTVGRWCALCREIAEKVALDRRRSVRREGKASERPTDRADEHVAPDAETPDEAIDRRRALAEMRAVMAPADLPVFDLWVEGHSQKEIGQKLDMSPRQVSRKVADMRVRLARLLLLPAVAALLAVAAYFLFRKKLGPDDEAHHTPAPSATPSEVPSAVPSGAPAPSPEELAERRARAEELRKRASDECDGFQFEECGDALADAAKLDPEGDKTRRVQRLHGESRLGIILDQMEGKGAPAPRVLRPAARTELVAALAPSSGQVLELACERSSFEPVQLCQQLTSALKDAGWTVQRVPLAPDAGKARDIRIEVATDADEATQNAADALARSLRGALLLARGPRDMAPSGGAKLRLTVGVQ